MENTVPKYTEAPISQARLDANRANARRSTGPRTPLGKARSASNSLQHGFYSFKNIQNFVHDPDMALAVTHNYLDQFIPVTPMEHTLVHQLIHLELRFLQMQYLYDQALICRVDDFLRTPVPTIPLILRELDRLPNRMQKVLKLLRQELAFRDEKTEIEAIPDHPKLPALPDNAYYRVVLTDDGAVPVQAFDETRKIETNPTGSSHTGPFGLTGKEIFHEFCKTIMMGYDAQPKDIKKERNEANEEASQESTLEARSEPIAA